MSWSIAIHGTHEAVKKSVEADTHVPRSLKEAVGLALAPFDEEVEVTLTTNGHIGENGQGNLMLQVVSAP